MRRIFHLSIYENNTATAFVSNIESVQQTLNIILENFYLHVFIPVELLIWIRSVAIVLLIVAHAILHVPTKENEQVVRTEHQQMTLSPELIEAIRCVTVQESQTEHTGQKGLPEPEVPDNSERVKAYMVEHPNAKVREVAQALSISPSTTNKWMRQMEEEANTV